MRIFFISCFMLLVISSPQFVSAQSKIAYAVLTGKENIIWEREMKLNEKVIPLFDTGTFHYKFKVDTPGLYTLSHENKRIGLFISPGDSLHLNLTKGAIAITGNSGSLNMALQDHLKVAQRNVDFLDKNNAVVFSLALAVFNQKIDSLQSAEIKSLQEFIIKNESATKRLKDRLAADIRYRTKRYQLLYPHNYNRHTNKIPPVSSNYFEVITKNRFDYPELLSSDAFVRYVDLYLNIQAAGKFKFLHLDSGPVERINSRYQAIIQLPARQIVKDFFMGQHFKKALEDYSIKYLTFSLAQLEKDCKDEKIKQQVRHLYKKAIEHRQEAHAIKVFKRVGDVELEAHIFYPDNFNKKDKRPAYLFFHGGGWAIGMPEWGYGNCKKFSSQGMVAISFEYRLRKVHGTHIAEAVSDALSAVSWVRAQAAELGIDPEKIIAAGFSAGAHLAACTAMIRETKVFGQEQKFSSTPNAVILHSAPYSVAGRDAANPKVAPELQSPLSLVQNNLVPALLFHGKEDEMVKFSEFESFVQKMTAANNHFTQRAFEGTGHFFYDPKVNKLVTDMTDSFLVAHGYLEK